MTLRLYDTATREIRDFVPLKPGKAGHLRVRADRAVGAARRATSARRSTSTCCAAGSPSRGYQVDFIRNVTDIDDKILAKSAEQGVHWYDLASAMKRELDAALAAINVLPPTYEPGATGHVPEIVELIEQLIARGHAYAAEDGSGDVYFDVRSWPSYGELTRQRVDDMEPAGDADPRGKRDPRDFALWKGWKKESEPETASWPSPWGPGRPGWHIECSAMAGKYLGPAFDIHGGGVDLRFPHHENEQAQSRAAGRPFASYWLHNAWITTAGEKMSKSLGNSMLIPSVLERVRGIELRYYIVAAHYRSHVEFSFEALEESAKAFRRLEDFLDRAAPVVGSWFASMPDAFREAMDDDLGTPAAVAVIHDVGPRGQPAAGRRALRRAQPEVRRGGRDARRAGAQPRRPRVGDRPLRRPADRGRRRAGEGTARGEDGGARGQGLGPCRCHPRPDQGGRLGDRGHLDRPTVDHRSGERVTTNGR